MGRQYGRERETVRELARNVIERASSGEYEVRRKRWRDVNALRRPDRPPVWCRPVGAWPELLPEGELVCQDPYLCRFEREFRRNLIKDEIGDDTIFDPFCAVGAVFDQEPEHTWGVEIKRILPGEPAGAWQYDPPLKTEEDFDRLEFPSYAYNDARTREELSRADELLGDIMPVRLTCGPPLGGGLGGMAANLRGLGQMMLDMAARPELTHRLMRHLQQGVLRAHQQVEQTGLLTLNNNVPMYCAEPPRGEPAEGKVRLSDLWINTESQEFQEVSPAMWEEFLLNYQMPILEKFGYVSYGCCEDLTHKIDGVLSIPNLRIFVCSAWTNLEKVVEAIGDRYALMWREKATRVIFEDMEQIRKCLDRDMRIARGTHVQIVLREVQTLNGNLRRLHEWTRAAIEVAEKYA